MRGERGTRGYLGYRGYVWDLKKVLQVTDDGERLPEPSHANASPLMEAKLSHRANLPSNLSIFRQHDHQIHHRCLHQIQPLLQTRKDVSYLPRTSTTERAADYEDQHQDPTTYKQGGQHVELKVQYVESAPSIHAVMDIIGRNE